MEIPTNRWDHMASLQTSLESIQDDEGNSKLMQAILSGNLELVKSELEASETSINRQRMDGRTALHLVCQSETDVSIVQFLIDHQADPNIRDVLGNVPVFYAIENGYFQSTMLLLKSGCSLEEHTTNNDTLLHLACFHGSPLQVLEYLIKNKCEVDARNKQGVTPLMFASGAGHECLVQFLIDHEADCSISDNMHSNPVHYCCFGGHDNPKILHLLNKWLNNNTLDMNGHTPLIYAIENGKLNLLKCLIDLKVDVACHRDGNTGWTPLHWVCRSSEEVALKLAKLLVGAGVDINTKDLSLRTPLMCCASEGQVQVLKFLLDERANVTGETSGYKFTALHLAAMCDRDRGDMVRMLIEAGCNVNARTGSCERFAIPSKVTPLMEAAKSGNINMINELLKGNADVSLTDNRGWTAFHYACIGQNQDQNTKVIDVLLKAQSRGAQSRFQGTLNSFTKEGQSPVALASTYGRTKILKHLLLNGSDVNNTRTKEKCTPLLEVCHLKLPVKNIEESITILLDHGAKINTTDRNGSTPLIKAVKNIHMYSASIVEILLKQGVDINHKDNNGKTALHYVSSSDCKNIDIVHLLVEECGDINVQDDKGWTPLMYAVQNNNLEIVKYFIKEGAYLNTVDNQSKSVMHIACGGKTDAKELVDELIQYNCPANLTSKDQKRPLDVALKNKHLDSAELIVQTVGFNKEATAHVSHEVFCACLAKGLDRLLAKVPRDIVTKFIKMKAQESGLYPVHLVSNVEQVRFLVEHGANTNDRSSEGFTLLHYKILDSRWHETNLFHRLLKVPNVNPNMRDDGGRTALHIVCNIDNVVDIPGELKKEEIYLKYAKLLIEANADVNLRDNNNETPLSVALKSKFSKMIALLDSKKALVYNKEGCCFRAIQYLALQWDKYVDLDNNAKKFSKELMKYDIELNCEVPSGHSALFYASLCKNVFLAQLLSHDNAYIKTNDQNKLPLLPWIIFSSEPKDVADLILKYVTTQNVNQSDSIGRTVLHYLARMDLLEASNEPNLSILRKRYAECIRVLVNNGVNLDGTDNNGDTPFMLAFRDGHREMATLLLKEGAKPNIFDREDINRFCFGGLDLTQNITQEPSTCVMARCLQMLRHTKVALEHYPEQAMLESNRKDLQCHMGNLISLLSDSLMNSQSAKVISEKHEWVITQNYDELCKCMQPDEVIHKLISKGIFSLRESEILQQETIRWKSVEKLLKFIVGRGPHVLPVLIEALHASRQEYLAHRLEDSLNQIDGSSKD